MKYPPNPYFNWPEVGSTTEFYAPESFWTELTAQWLRIREEWLREQNLVARRPDTRE